MKHKFSIFSMLLVSFGLLFLFTSCDEDSEPLYEAYGLISKTEGDQFRILLDDGTELQARESYVNLKALHDSTRLYLHFNLLEETEKAEYVRITYADTLLTKSVLPYDETILDSIGDDPVKITKAWFAHDFINFEFIYAGRYNITREYAHMVNLLQCPTEEGTLTFEFRHNDFEDYRDRIYMGVVSFPIKNIVHGLEKPVKMKVKFNDSQNTTRSIELTYR